MGWSSGGIPLHGIPKCERPRLLSRGALLFGVLIIVAAVFSPSLFNGFIKNDDPYHLLENVTLRAWTLENLRAMFQSIINTTYIPLTTLSFAMEYHFFGYNPFVYHLDNLVLHLGVVALVFFFFQRLGLSALAAAIGVLFFGIHPMHVESVAWVTERKDVLYAFFYLLAVHQYWEYAKSGKGKSYLLSLVCCSLSILAKPMALSLPLILFLCDWWMGRAWKRGVLLEKAPYFLIVTLIAGVTYLWNARDPVHSAGEAVLLWIWCLAFYLRKFIFPDHLIIFYQFPRPFSLANGEFAVSVFILMLVIFLLFYFRKQRLFVFSVLFYFLSIFFLLRMDDVENINPVSDRFMYLPSVGFCALLGVGFAQFLERDQKWPYAKQAGIALLAAASIVMAVQAFQQCRFWRDGSILWSAVIDRSPRLALAYIHRGAAYQEKGDIPSAMADYQKAIELNKDEPYAHSNLAMIYKDQRRFKDAEHEYGKAISLKPDFWGAYFDRGNLYRETGQLAKAIDDYTKAIKLLPGYAEAYENRGIAYFFSRQDDLALADFNRALRFDPRDINAVNNRAVIYAKRGDLPRAIRDFSRSIDLDPGKAEIYYNRGLAYYESRRYDLAVIDFDHALRLRPDYYEASLRKAEIERMNVK